LVDVCGARPSARRARHRRSRRTSSFRRDLSSRSATDSSPRCSRTQSSLAPASRPMMPATAASTPSSGNPERRDSRRNIQRPTSAPIATRTPKLVTSKSPIRNSTGYVCLDVSQISLAGAVQKPLEESDEDVDEQAGGGTCHTNADGMREDADHSLVRAVRSGAVRTKRRQARTAQRAPRRSSALPGPPFENVSPFSQAD
jgi:hypothetical protein